MRKISNIKTPFFRDSATVADEKKKNKIKTDKVLSNIFRKTCDILLWGNNNTKSSVISVLLLNFVFAQPWRKVTAFSLMCSRDVEIYSPKNYDAAAFNFNTIVPNVSAHDNRRLRPVTVYTRLKRVGIYSNNTCVNCGHNAMYTRFALRKQVRN